MKFNLRTKTVLVIVGPHNCGKTTFAENFRIDTQKLGLKTAVLSTDGFRRILLDEPGAHSWDHRMMEVSGMAFQMLEHAYTAALHYTVANDFIIIDSKGYDASFRDRIRKAGQDAGWDVVMVIMQPEKDEYLDPAQAAKQISLRQRIVTQEAIDNWVNTKNKALGFFRQKIVGDLGHKGWDGIFRLRRYEDVNTMEIEVKNLDAINSSRIRHWMYDTVIVIPDFHENLEALQNVIIPGIQAKMNEEGRKNTHYVFMGDYLDKGGRTRETIDFMHDLVFSGQATVIDGNHENYAHKRITGQIKEPDLALEEKWFTSVQVLLNDEALATKFLDIRKRTVPFVYMPGAVTHKSIYITHAPCENKHLGGWSIEAMRKQRNFIFHRDSEMQDQMGFIYREARGGDPLHLFGHVSHDGWADCRNKFFMDKGIEANNIACIGLIRDGELELFEIPLHNAGKTDLPKSINKPIKREKPFDLADYNLDMDDHRFIRSAKRNKLRFISGTMAPAPSTDTEIESLRAGLNAFVKQGITKVMLQPKYMGSRAQMYIYPELEKCHFVSRNGFRVRDREEFDPIFEQYHTKFSHVFDEPYDPDTVEPLIIDGELLPWHVLGEELINREFGDYQNAIAFELGTLGKDKAFEKLEFKNKLDVNTKLANLKIFSDNLSHYGAPGPVEFRGFDVLTYRDKLGITDHATAFETVNDHGYVILYLLEDQFDSSYETAKQFFDTLTVQEKMEGVVIKPLVEEPGKLPYMKVRNEEYLTLIYGYDYHDRYERLSAQKNVTGKARLAIKERELGLRMLTEEVGSSKWMESVVKLIFALKEEKTLDPRL